MQNKLPSQKHILLTWAILLIYLTVYFVINAKEIFFQLNYDWHNVKVYDTVKGVKIDSISNDLLVVHGYNSESERLLNADNTYIIGPTNNYFRTTNVKCNDGEVVFSGIKWINGIPEYSIKKTNLQIVDLPLTQLGSKKLVTIGDSQIIWREGREFRKKLASLHGDLVFIGNHKDVYGYPYEGELDAKCDLIFQKLKAIDSADTYILFFGAHDKRTNDNELNDCVNKVFEWLVAQKGKKNILAITLPPSTNPEFNAYNTRFNQMIMGIAKHHRAITVIDLNEHLERESDYLYHDKVHLNRKGYDILIQLLYEELK